MKFSEFNLHPDLLKGINKAGFEECMPVQVDTFTHTLNHKDVLVQSQTGSGKTAAFIITIFQLFIQNRDSKNRALIVAPTRELAVQIEMEARMIGEFLPFKTGCFYGGAGYTKQEEMLKKGVDLIIGTPGRLLDFSRSGKIKFREFSVLVLDEADRMLDMGFYPDIRAMLKMMPPADKRMSMLFSATLTERVKNLAFNFMNDPVEIELAPDHLTVETVTQKLYHVSTDEKMKLMLGLLRKIEPKNAIFFTNMKSRAVEVAKRLQMNGYTCEYIIGDLPQKKRLSIINSIKSGELKFLVATDVAARGLHIDDLELVVNYDLPLDCENYVHRIGRTARVGKTGMAISLACEKYVYGLEAIESYIDMKIPVEWPDEDDFGADTSAGMRVGYDEGHHRKKVKGAPGARQTRKRSGDVPSSIKRTSVKGTQVTSRGGKGKMHEQAGSEKRNERDRRPSRSQDRNYKQQPLEERLEYYKRKYGEDFVPVSETESAERKAAAGRKAGRKTAASGNRGKNAAAGRNNVKKPAAANARGRKNSAGMNTAGKTAEVKARNVKAGADTKIKGTAERKKGGAIITRISGLFKRK